MCSSVDYWRCRWIKLGGALEYPQRGPSDPHPGPDLSTACPQGYPQGWREDPQGVENGTRRCGDAHICPSTEARSPPRRANWAVRIQVPVREGGAGSSSSAVAHRGAPTTPLAPGRAVGAVAVGAQPGTAPARSRAARPGPAAWPARRARHPLAPGPRCPVEAAGVDPRRACAAGATPRLRPIRAPVPTGVLDGGHRRSVIADQDRVGVGGPPGSTRTRTGRGGSGARGASAARLNAGADKPVDAAAREAVATPVPFAPSVSARARAVRWRSDPATQKGGRRVSFTPRPALLPSRNGAMTPFLGRAGAAAHPKVTRRPPFSAPPTLRAATAGPPEASTAPGPSSAPARPRRRGSPAGRPAGITAPPRVRPASAGSAPMLSRPHRPGGGRRPRSAPTARPAWWDGVSHVVTRPARLGHLRAVGPLAFRWTTVFREPGGPTARKWPKQGNTAMTPLNNLPPIRLPRGRRLARRLGRRPGRVLGGASRHWPGGGGVRRRALGGAAVRASLSGAASGRPA